MFRGVLRCVKVCGGGWKWVEICQQEREGGGENKDSRDAL